MSSRPLFVTQFYEGTIADTALLATLAHSCRSLARDDAAGRRWARDHGYAGYTSYASLDDLPARDPAFADLKRHLDRHVGVFVTDAALDIGRRKPRLDSLWVNILRPGGAHSGHIHPHSIVSGTVYIEVPPGAGPLKLEDPRLPMLMNAPARRGDAPEALQSFVYAAPSPGTIFLWESWLRHEVPASRAKADRISISFNYS
jgi:uncharacterized protein (TIGR02466 family)